MKRLFKVLVSLVVLFGLVFGTVELVRMANGDFAGDYKLSGVFPSAGEGLHPGSAVVFRGVQVGRVSTITLYQNQAQVTLLMEPSFKVPASSTATIEPVNLFGAEQVSISSPHRNSDAGPYLTAGATFAHATSSDELGDLFAAATPLLNQINANQLSTVLGELAQASQGEGRKIAAGIDAGTQLAGLLDKTLNAQILALDSFAKFSQAVAPAASDLNNLNAQVNAGLPGFNAEEADYENLLNTLIPFSNRLAALLSTYHPDIATILQSGDNVSRVLLAQQDTIGQVINGAYHYFQKIAEGASGLNKLPDGSTYAYFNTFILFTDVNSLVCNLIAPPTGGMSYLEPLQQALAGAGSAFNCSSELSTFNALQSSATAATPPASTPAAATSPTSSANSAGAAAANQVYGIVGQPDTSKPTTLGGLLQQLLGGNG
ncbi:MAG TPA: MlaD family protein [Acidimicrobiales bacterium]|jgi:virulence factor Mce-like protein|nr:MlaD family protein [Acidimicrobiales bacterium]